MQLYPTGMNREPRPSSRRPSNSRAAPDDSRAALTDLELRELIEETALLHAKRRRHAQCTPQDWTEAHQEVMERLRL